jgi:hypothetical protein
MGILDSTTAKPVYMPCQWLLDEGTSERDVVLAYRKTHVRLATSIAAPQQYTTVGAHISGNAFDHYASLTNQDLHLDRTIVGVAVTKWGI